ncbi:hypothetical protein [Roseibium alexandrii]|uniref:hypothetical protein n=1 Tax=Roseibium alexandrii TaxID=388408 RepID=UPI0037511415
MPDIKVIKGAELSLPKVNLEGFAFPQLPFSSLAVDFKVTGIDERAVAALEIQSLTGRSPKLAERGVRRIYALAEAHPITGYELLQEWKRRTLWRSWGEAGRIRSLGIFLRDS